MSALDWGGGAGTNATPRYYELVTPTLPDSDWCIGGWLRRTGLTGANLQKLIAIGPAGAAGGLYLYIGETTFGFEVGGEIVNDAGTSWLNAAAGSSPTNDGFDYLWVVQRRSNTCEVYMTREGQSASASISVGSVSGTIGTQASANIGSDGSYPCRFPIGEFFLFNNRSLSAAEVTTLAAGARATAVATPLILLPFRSGQVSTETNLGSGGATYNSTIVDTGFTTTADFFSLSSGASDQALLMLL